jgi:hypothetical protein
MNPLHDNMDLETPEAIALRADASRALTLSQLLLLSRP